MHPPKVAVVVRTRDRPQLLARALRSIAAQRFQELECVVVDDGGAPGSAQAVVDASGLAARVLRHDESSGRWASANTGVRASTAPLIVLHDDDDSWHPDFLATAVDYLDEHPERGGVVSRIERVWEEERDGELVEVRRDRFEPGLDDPLLADLMRVNRFVPIGFLYRRALHDELGLYDERLPVVGDWDFHLRVLARGPIEFLGGEPLARWHHRQHAAGAAANSVIGDGADHRRWDALVRDAALREHVREHGAGLPLYLTRHIDRRVGELHGDLLRDLGGDLVGMRAALESSRDETRALAEELEALRQDVHRLEREYLGWFPRRIGRRLRQALRRR